MCSNFWSKSWRISINFQVSHITFKTDLSELIFCMFILYYRKLGKLTNLDVRIHYQLQKSVVVVLIHRIEWQFVF